MHSANIAKMQMESLWEYVDMGAMDASIDRMRSLDLSPPVVDFVLNPDSYLFPQIEEVALGEYLLPEDKIAVVALEKSQKYLLGSKVVFHELQRESLKNNGFSHKEVIDIEQAFATNEDETVASKVTACVGSVCGFHMDTQGGRIFAKPAIVFVVEPGNNEVKKDPSAAMHEIVHGAQRLSRAFSGWHETVQKRELEALVTQGAGILNDHRIPYTKSATLAAEAFQYHQRYIGGNSYEITPEFKSAVRPHPVLSRIFC